MREALQEAIGDQDDDMNCSDDSIGCCSSDDDHVDDDNDDHHHHDHHHDNVAIPMYTASGELTCDYVIHYDVITLVSKATRSLSAVQRKQPTVMSEGTGVSDDVLLALQLENNAISHTSTAAALHQPHPPATPSTAKTIEMVTEQVKMMNYK